MKKRREKNEMRGEETRGEKGKKGDEGKERGKAEGRGEQRTEVKRRT